jgi:hypothetical protein
MNDIARIFVGKNYNGWYVRLQRYYGSFDVWEGHPSWEEAYSVAYNVARFGLL